jgi:hypothetical protein
VIVFVRFCIAESGYVLMSQIFKLPRVYPIADIGGFLSFLLLLESLY